MRANIAFVDNGTAIIVVFTVLSPMRSWWWSYITQFFQPFGLTLVGKYCDRPFA